MRCAVLGDPIAHSLSPVLHRAGYAAVGLDWEYDAVRVAERRAGRRSSPGSTPSWRGLSLTMPLKREALALAADASPTGPRLAGAANTLVLDGRRRRARRQHRPAGRGRRRPGAVRRPGHRRHRARRRRDRRLDRPGPVRARRRARSRLLVRSPERAAEAAARDRRAPVGPRGRGRLPLADDPVERRGRGVHDPGRGPGRRRWSPAAPTSRWSSRSSTTPGRRRSPRPPRDRVLVGGLDLLVHQAALQFELFTGVPGPLDAMRAAGEEALATRRAAR